MTLGARIKVTARVLTYKLEKRAGNKGFVCPAKYGEQRGQPDAADRVIQAAENELILCFIA